jgi:hypothetical protein
VDEKRRTLKEFAKNAIGNPFRVARPFSPITQGSALNARNPGLEVVNDFGVIVCHGP